MTHIKGYRLDEREMKPSAKAQVFTDAFFGSITVVWRYNARTGAPPSSELF